MRSPSSHPIAAATPSELFSSLETGDLLVGYEAVLDAILERLDGASATACLGTARSFGDHEVPSVIVVLEDQIVEGWLTGNTVRTAVTPRPGVERSTDGADPASPT